MEAIPEKRWGDPDFDVKAEATSGLSIVYTSAGGCSISGNTLSLVEVGSCTITASQAGNESWEFASDALTFDIKRANPVITFEGMSVRFTRDLHMPLWATSAPTIPFAYSIVQTEDSQNDTNCTIANGEFTFLDSPRPTLVARCAVMVEAAEVSPNYLFPGPVIAVVEITFPSWEVEILPPPAEVSFSGTGGAITITIFERSGNAYGVELFQSGDCSVGDPGDSYFFADPQPEVPRGTTQYTAEVTLEDPSGVEDASCTIGAAGFPGDHSGGKSNDWVTFAIVP